MLTRRQLIVAAGAVPLGMTLAAADLMAESGVTDASATNFPTLSELIYPRRPGAIIHEPETRQFGPVMFIGDSTSARRVARLPGNLASHGLGPYWVDLNLARLIARDKSRRPSAITAVRKARDAGFDPPAYVIALGFSDILGANQDPRFLKDPKGTTVSMVEELLTEIGADRTVGFLNLFGTVSSKSSRAKLFNAGLNMLAPHWPKLHIIDWASVAKRHIWWHRADGFHYGWVGALERQKFVAKAMVDTVTFAAAASNSPPSIAGGTTTSSSPG